MKKTLIQHIEVTESAGRAVIEFTTIPQTYKDLYLVVSSRSSRADDIDVVDMTFNSVSSGYSYRSLYGDTNTGAESYSDGSDPYVMIQYPTAANVTANTFSNSKIYIPNYTSNEYKTISTDYVSERNTTGNVYLILMSYLWANNSAISSIQMDMRFGNFVQYSSASLYGITAGNDGITTVS